MRKIIAFFCLFIFISLWVCIQADVYVKGVLHIDGGYRYGHIVPDIDAVNEWWFGKDRVTFITTGWQLEFMGTDWRFTLDKEKKQLLVINLKNKTVVNISLEKPPLSYVDPSYVRVLDDFRFNGTVEKQGVKKKFLKKTCDVYRVLEWLMEVDLRFYERERTILVNPDVPFDWRLFNELFQWLRSFFNPDPAYVDRLQTIKGFIMKSHETYMPRGGRLTWDFKVMEISHKKAPENVYGIPKDYKQQEKFSLRDLRTMITIVYTWPIY